MGCGRKEIRFGKVGKAARHLGMELHAVDRCGNTVKVFVASLHLPQSGLSIQDCRDALDKLEADFDAVKSEDAILVIGSDVNAAVGTNVEAGMDEHDSQSSSPAGPCRVHHLNDRGMVFLEWLLKMGLCSVGTFFQKPSHVTWQIHLPIFDPSFAFRECRGSATRRFGRGLTSRPCATCASFVERDIFTRQPE